MKKNRQRNYDQRGIDSSCLAYERIIPFVSLKPLDNSGGFYFPYFVILCQLLTNGGHKMEDTHCRVIICRFIKSFT